MSWGMAVIAISGLWIMVMVLVVSALRAARRGDLIVRRNLRQATFTVANPRPTLAPALKAGARLRPEQCAPSATVLRLPKR